MRRGRERYGLPCEASERRPDPGVEGQGAAVTVVLYPGSFDPVHNGHVEIVETAARLFDRVVVAAMRNPQKGEPLFSLEDRQALSAGLLQPFPSGASCDPARIRAIPAAAIRCRLRDRHSANRGTLAARRTRT